MIPKAFRDYMEIGPEDEVEWLVSKDGHVIVKPKKQKSVLDVEGALEPDFPIYDMEEVIEDSKYRIGEKKMKEGSL